MFLLLPCLSRAEGFATYKEVKSLNLALDGRAEVLVDDDAAHVICGGATLSGEYDGNFGFLYKEIGRNGVVLVPTGSGYGGVNVFYRAVAISPEKCFVGYEGEIANPVLNGSAIESSARSGYRYHDASYELESTGYIRLVSERNNYYGFCIQVKPKAEIPAVDCKTHEANVFRKIQQERVYLYESHDGEMRSGSYLIEGDEVRILDFVEGAGRVLVSYSGAKASATGWVDYSVLWEN